MVRTPLVVDARSLLKPTGLRSRSSPRATSGRGCPSSIRALSACTDDRLHWRGHQLSRRRTTVQSRTVRIAAAQPRQFPVDFPFGFGEQGLLLGSTRDVDLHPIAAL